MTVGNPHASRPPRSQPSQGVQARERERGERERGERGGRQGRAKLDRGGSAPNTSSNNAGTDNSTSNNNISSFEDQQQMTQRMLRQYLPRSPSSSLLPSSIPSSLPPATNLPHTPNPIQHPSSSIQGQTYFLSAKSDIQAMLGGDYDYSQRQKDLSHLLTLKEHISQNWDYKEKSSMYSVLNPSPFCLSHT